MVDLLPASERGEDYDAICWYGDWRHLPQTCGGNVEVWDQTVGCPECGMNLWYLPGPGQWPEWDEEPGEEDRFDRCCDLFERLHPFGFKNCHDYGDAHDDLPRWNIGP